jgi:quercetin dioxygenase-like cupin family protein
LNPNYPTRRDFHRSSLFTLISTMVSTAHAEQKEHDPSSKASSRRLVIKQMLSGDPPREITLVEVVYAPGAGSPPHLHTNGVMAFVVSGSIASKVGEGPEHVFQAGDAWWEPPGAIHRVSRNASNVEGARLLAIYIAPKGATGADLMKPL